MFPASPDIITVTKSIQMITLGYTSYIGDAPCEYKVLEEKSKAMRLLTRGKIRLILLK
jgi:hypothetical protein